MTVTIEKKVTKKFEVEAQLSDNIEKEGYKVKNISVDPKTVRSHNWRRNSESN